MRPSSVAQARSDSSGQRAKACNAESGAAHRAPEQAVTRAVTQPVIETWQARENCVAGVSIDQFPSHRITRIGLDSRAQVRRLLGMRIVARCTRGLAKLSAAAMAFGTLSDFRKTEFGHLHMIALGRWAGRARVTFLF
jgi:hypothetical protein